MDQENLNLTVSCSPHVHAADGTRDIMLDVVIALIPVAFVLKIPYVVPLVLG